MKRWRDILPYLILNVLVSGLTTLGVLWWWKSTQAPASPAASAPRGGVFTPTQTALPPTLPPVDQPVISIENIFGVNDLQTEVVVLKRLGEGDLWLTSWSLEEEGGQKFTFPKLLLNKNGAVQVLTRAGPDTVIELHWGLPGPVWQSGEAARLLDPEGNLRAEFQIP